MGNHVTQVVHLNDGRFQARCNCRAVSEYVTHHWQAEDWMLSHRTLIERVKTQNRQRNPSLKDQRDYFRSKAEDPNTDSADRWMWRSLAEELDHRLNEAGADPALQPELPFD